MSLRTKFTLYISFIILFIIVGISESVFLTQKQLLQSQLEENRKKIFDDFVYACNEALIVKDEIQIYNTIKSIIKTHNPAIVYAGYMSPSGTILFNSRDHDQETNLRTRIIKISKRTNQEFISQINEKIVEFSIPFYIQNEYRGTVTAGFSQKYLEFQIKEGLDLIFRRILIVSVLYLIIGVILANIMAFYINRPIKTLAIAADEIGDGNLDIHIDIKRKDEIGRLVQRFNQMAKKLKELDELKDGFVSSVSHELRSPLAAIDGYCDYMLDSISKNLSAEKQEKSLKIIKEATIRLTNFINNILDLAKMKAGKFEVRKSPVDINELAHEIVSLFESLAAKQNKKIEYITNDVDLPKIDVDSEKVKQVITNLIGNALKFTQENASITVSARFYKTSDFIEVWVADTGIGIPPEALAKVFDRFYQVKESEMKKPKGTGLGLAIVAEIIKLHNGKIWVESTLGNGSIFKFTLPVWKENL